MNKARANGGPGSADPTPVKFTLCGLHIPATKCLACHQSNRQAAGRPTDGAAGCALCSAPWNLPFRPALPSVANPS